MTVILSPGTMLKSPGCAAVYWWIAVTITGPLAPPDANHDSAKNKNVAKIALNNFVLMFHLISQLAITDDFSLLDTINRGSNITTFKETALCNNTNARFSEFIPN